MPIRILKGRRKRRREVLTGEEARQGEIVLKTPLMRAIFAGTLIVIIVVAVVWRIVIFVHG